MRSHACTGTADGIGSRLSSTVCVTGRLVLSRGSCRVGGWFSEHGLIIVVDGGHFESSGTTLSSTIGPPWKARGVWCLYCRFKDGGGPFRFRVVVKSCWLFSAGLPHGLWLRSHTAAHSTAAVATLASRISGCFGSPFWQRGHRNRVHRYCKRQYRHFLRMLRERIGFAAVNRFNVFPSSLVSFRFGRIRGPLILEHGDSRQIYVLVFALERCLSVCRRSP